VRFQDCDPLGHLNNARYFDYFLNARGDQVQALYGFDTLDIFQKYGTSWVIYNHNISFIRAAAIGEKIQIHSRLIDFDKHTIIIEFFMTDDTGTILKNLLWSTMKYIDAKQGRMTEHQPEITQHLQAIVLPIDTQQGIQQRIKNLKAELLKPHQSL
jgi:acyl-CoA thioester hydrolase